METVRLLTLFLIAMGSVEVNRGQTMIINTDDEIDVSMTLLPGGPSLNMMQGKSRNITVQYLSNGNTRLHGALALNCYSGAHNDEIIAITQQTNESTSFETPFGNASNFECVVHGLKIGRTYLSIFVIDSETGQVVWNYSHPNSTVGYPIVVIQPMTKWKLVVQLGVVCIMAVNIFAFGCRLKLDEVKACLRQPFGIFIGFICQYGINPTIGYVLGRILDLPSRYSFALLVMSCVPAGMPSNVATLRMKGDFNLSIIMTTFSNLVSFGMTSLWLFTLGKILLQKDYPLAKVSIPWMMFGIIVALLTIPVFVGILIRYYHPKIAKRLSVVIRSIVLVVALFLLVIAFWEYSWIFTYMNNWKILVAGAVLPYSACLVSLLLVLITRRSLKVSLTIVIEAGIQNAAFAMLIIQDSVPAPDNGLAITIAMTFVLFTYVPLLFMIVVRAIYDIIKAQSHQANLKNVSLRSQSSVTSLELKGLPAEVMDNSFATGRELSTHVKNDFGGSATDKTNVKIFYKSDSTTMLVDNDTM